MPSSQSSPHFSEVTSSGHHKLSRRPRAGTAAPTSVDGLRVKLVAMLMSTSRQRSPQTERSLDFTTQKHGSTWPML